jgi:hypothetical protein
MGGPVSGRVLRCYVCSFRYTPETYEPGTLPHVRVPVHYRSGSYTRSPGIGDVCPGIGSYPVEAGAVPPPPPRTADDLDGTHC